MFGSDDIPIKNVIGAASQPFTQLRPTAAAWNTTDGDRDGLALADQNDQSFAASDTRVEQIALQHWVVLRHDWDNDGRVIRALALMDRRSISRHQRVQFAKAIGNRMPIKDRGKFPAVRLDPRHVANVAVVDLLIVIVLDLHDFVAGREGPTEPFDLAFASGIQGCLEFDIEGARSNATAVHWAENLDIADGIKAEPARDPGFHKLDDAGDRGLGIIRLDKIEIA